MPSSMSLMVCISMGTYVKRCYLHFCINSMENTIISKKGGLLGNVINEFYIFRKFKEDIGHDSKHRRRIR